MSGAKGLYHRFQGQLYLTSNRPNSVTVLIWTTPVDPKTVKPIFVVIRSPFPRALLLPSSGPPSGDPVFLTGGPSQSVGLMVQVPR